MTFEAGIGDSYRVAWWSVHVTSKPENIHRAVTACLDVLRSVATSRMQPYELERAKVTVLAKHEAEVKARRPACWTWGLAMPARLACAGQRYQGRISTADRSRMLLQPSLQPRRACPTAYLRACEHTPPMCFAWDYRLLTALVACADQPVPAGPDELPAI